MARRALRKLERIAHRSLRTRGELAQMKRSSGSRVREIALAIEATLDHEIGESEAKAIDEIEALRTELLASILPADGVHTVGDLCRTASKTYLWTLLLFKIIRLCRPVRCLELGTCIGISAAYQAAALKLNDDGFLTTLEGSEPRARIAEENLRRLALDNANVRIGQFQELLPSTLEENAPLDYVFIDGHHQEDATIAYFDRIAPYLSSGAVVVLDDISWSPGMKRAWQAVCSRDAVAASVDLFLVGICVVGSDHGSANRFRLSIG